MPISEEIKQAIIDDLREDRLDFEEIAIKRLGDAKKKYAVSQIAKENGLSRKDRRGKKRKSWTPKVVPQKTQSNRPLKITTFDPKTRLSLIDEAITTLKSLLPEIKDPYKMERWSAALERLLEQRRTEEPKDQNDSENVLLSKIVGSLEQHAEHLSTQASPSVPGLSKD